MLYFVGVQIELINSVIDTFWRRCNFPVYNLNNFKGLKTLTLFWEKNKGNKSRIGLEPNVYD